MKLLVAIATALLAVIPLSAAVSPPRPNIVFFLIDDLGYADCGFSGGKEIKTPHIDALAVGGAVLESHYVQPVCSPTRSALMTGRYPARTGVYSVIKPGAKWGLPLSERTLANALRMRICGTRGRDLIVPLLTSCTVKNSTPHPAEPDLP